MSDRSRWGFLVTLIVAVGLAACQDGLVQTEDMAGPGPEQVATTNGAPMMAVAGDPGAQLRAMMDGMNVKLAETGANYRVAKAEAITAASSGEVGIMVLAKDVGNKQLNSDYVPGDARRSWAGPGNTVTYAIDQVDAVPLSPGVTAGETNAAINAAMGTWDDEACSDLGLTQVPDFGIDIGVVAFQNGLGGSPFIFADIQHAGFSDINFAGGVIGATFTFMFCDPCGAAPVFTDINDDGKDDTAFAEIYYDPSWFWGVDGSPGFVDVESIALHEAGHGLSQGHFGTVFIKSDGVSLKRSPYAVMNALYSEPLRELQGTDDGGHCSLWGNWPSN